MITLRFIEIFKQAELKTCRYNMQLAINAGMADRINEWKHYMVSISGIKVQ